MTKKRQAIRIFCMVLVVFLLFLNCRIDKVGAKSPAIVINPGHSIGYDSGAVNSANGIQEAYINSQVAKYTAESLQNAGYNVYLTHPVDGCAIKSIMSSAEASKLANLSKVNTVNPDLVLSIHHNSSTNPNANGYEFYWSSYRDYDKEGIYEEYGLWGSGEPAFKDSSPCEEAKNSEVLASILKNNFAGNGLNYNKTVERDDYLPAHVKAPCVLIEGGYISNYWESYRLYTPEFQKDMASRIVKSVNQFFQQYQTSVIPKAENIEFGLDSGSLTMAMKHAKEETQNYETVFAIWNEDNPEKQIWTYGESNGKGEYTKKISLNDFNYQTGTYHLAVYCYDFKGKSYYLGESLTICSSSTPKLKQLDLDVSSGDLKISAAYSDKNLRDQPMTFSVWNTNDPSKQYWTLNKCDSEGNCSLIVDLSFFERKQAEYRVDVYSYDYKGKAVCMATKQISYLFKPKAENIKMEISNKLISVSGKHAYSSFNDKKMVFAIWNINNPNHQYWGYGVDEQNGKYSLSVGLDYFGNQSGTYRADIYCYDTSGNSYYLGTSEAFFASKPKAESINVAINNGKLEASAKHAYSTMNDYKMVFAVMNTNNPSRQNWSYGNSSGDGKYSIAIGLDYFENQSGTYRVDIYCYDRSGVAYCLGTKEVVYEPNTEKPKAESINVAINNGKLEASAKHAYSTMNDYKMVFAVMNTNNPSRQNWSYGNSSGDGKYSTAIGLDYFENQSGTYRVDIYCYDRSGVAYCLGTKEVVYEPNTEKPKAESINLAINNGKLEASAKHAYSTMNDYKMVFAVMNTNNPSRQNWSYGNSSGDGKYSTAIGLDYFENQSGTYRVDIYCYDRSGVAYYLGAKEVVYSNNDNGDKYNSNTSIMGKTEADVEKLVSVYTINSPIAFPQFYINQGIDLKSFASLYIEECEAEGVRGEVAFAQMLLETGYLSFTGDVRIEQYNFAGLGATGNGNPGNSLPDIRTGIRAQIQHLKCYASDQPLNNSCVDPRWGEWIRLKAPTVGQLSGTWAADKSYADKILTIMNQF
ncbi:N-acetylmuramoyl-L-alanine amidase AmiC precursor [[Butyribacterium] methylotrophicum]|uniref:N-acetylmuramoyl-L-alanine amidase n=3 Tax=Eubacterium callanderi TaxID=53442 RepID=UPI0008631AAC|nr:N-acetylmuramoyl-L-alanine amidase [Eubacterium callanderi]MCQ5191149.1 N-acetylmuramoyl-L-alanine amidase [Eubacterium callanderi]OEZ05109.1 N-acetylmuramoyl-L-alanine amidase AmiC precursor [[Butyribacterium] methylotrophicum]WPK84693.1 hypothetical protein EUCAMar_22420 [Eubacterium callanderi]